LVRPAPEALKLGETTQAQLIERLGAPTARESFERNGQPITVLAYVYTTEAERNHGDHGVIAARSLNLFFHDDRLVGHEFRSSAESDHTDFDPRKARAIVKGKSTRAEVEQLLGRPSGLLRYPVVAAPLGDALVYGYTQERRIPFGKPVKFTKSLLVTFDPGGIVNGAFYETTGTP
jgi:outer membrane protein assembly factor BamE (lipoprotein component of BamABCDE complex)